MLIGHQKVLDFLQKAIEHGTLAHTYCLVGPAGVGKQAVARQVAAKLLKISEEKLDSQPDFVSVQRLEDEKTGKLKKEVSVTQARELRIRLQRRSWSGGYQVAIIDDAELLNEESSNALLKILEEPAEKTIIFLLTENEAALLPTIKSRSQLLYCSLVKESEIKQGLEKMGYDRSLAEECARLASGRPGRAIMLAADPELKAQHNHEVKRWGSLFGRSFAERVKIIEDIFGDKEDGIRGREHLVEILEVWMLEWRKVLLEQSRNYSPAQIIKIEDSLNAARKLLGQNVHPRLVMENILLQF